MTCGHSRRRLGLSRVFPNLNACVATVTAGWCPTAARTTGAGTARRVCFFARRVPTVRRRAAAAPRAVEPSGRHLGTARRRARQPRNRRGGRRPRGARGGRAGGRSAGRADHRGHRRPRRQPAGPTPPSSPTPPNSCETVPNRESAELRWVAEDDVAGAAAASRGSRPVGPSFAPSRSTIPLLQAEL